MGLLGEEDSLETSKEHSKACLKGCMVPMEECDKVYPHGFAGEDTK